MTNAAHRTVSVELGARSYDVVIGDGLLADAGARLAPLAPRGRVAVVTDQNIDDLHGAALRASLAAADLDADVITLAPGEETKSFGELERLCDRLLDLQFERDDVIAAFGGGVVGDLAGFAAAIYKRGAPFV